MADRKITDTEKIAYDKLESNWDNVLRTTPRAIEQFEERYPKVCEAVNRKVREQGIEGLGNAFRPGVPDFLGFDDDGEYVFVEVKGEGDGLRHSQLKWFRDFQDLRAEIWFADSNDGITEKMSSDNLNSYSLKTSGSRSRGEIEVRESDRKGFLSVDLPETLAAAMELVEGDRVSWNVKNRSKLELDTD